MLWGVGVSFTAGFWKVGGTRLTCPECEKAEECDGVGTEAPAQGAGLGIFHGVDSGVVSSSELLCCVEVRQLWSCRGYGVVPLCRGGPPRRESGMTAVGKASRASAPRPELQNFNAVVVSPLLFVHIRVQRRSTSPVVVCPNNPTHCLRLLSYVVKHNGCANHPASAPLW